MSGAGKSPSRPQAQMLSIATAGPRNLLCNASRPPTSAKRAPVNFIHIPDSGHKFSGCPNPIYSQYREPENHLLDHRPKCCPFLNQSMMLALINKCKQIKQKNTKSVYFLCNQIRVGQQATYEGYDK